MCKTEVIIFIDRSRGYISIIFGFEQTAAWIVLAVVLLIIISGKIRFELAAFGGLLLLGLLGLLSPSITREE
jgi:hypothetical protein